MNHFHFVLNGDICDTMHEKVVLVVELELPQHT